ncbi:MAG TPA: hypothetical protein VFQ13_05075 [Anaerolineales bacterium]|nr:hypothetical protein [Anaerolineales bacterium]
MTANLKNFNRDLDQLLERRTFNSNDPALQAASALLSLDIDSEAVPPADLRARWLARTKPVATTERMSFMKLMRTRPFVAILIVLLTLLALSGVVYALGKVLGYIPGVGLVDQSMPLRVLAEPVSQTRDGITLTVEEALLSADKTVIRFRDDNISSDKLVQDGSGCDMSAELKLPDGTSLQTVGGFGLDSWSTGHESRFTFAPVPANVNEAIFVLPCIQSALPGTLPENWELTLRFSPAPADMTVAPVIEVTSPQNVSVESPMVLEKIIETEKGYILAGKFRSVSLPQDSKAVQFSSWPKITDASGQDVPFMLANIELDLPFDETDKGVFPWAFELDGKSFNWPLTIIVEAVVVEYSDAQAQFEFDTGPNPQNEQVWPLDIDIELAGYPVRVLQAIRTPDGYMFNFESKSPAMFHGVDLAIGNSSQGFSGMDSPINFSSSVSFAGEISSGKLNIILTRPLVALPGEWKLEWKPEDTPGLITTLPAPTQTP